MTLFKAKTVLLLLICLTSPAFSRGQIQFQRMTVDDGLSQNSGSALFQDSRGFIWIGTQDGLNKYDGLNFEIFRHDPGDSTSPGFNAVSAICEDVNGYIWVGSGIHGLDRLDPRTGIFRRYSDKLTEGLPFETNGVRAILRDRDRKLWVGSMRGLIRLDDAGETFKFFRIAEIGSAKNRISAIHEDSAGRLWVANFNQLFIFDRERETFEEYSLRHDSGERIEATFIASLIEDSRGSLWLAGGSQGLLRLNPATGRTTTYQHDPQDEQTLASGFVTTLVEDKHGNLWIGSELSGLSRLSIRLAYDTQRTNIFTRLAHDIASPYSLSNNSVVSLLLDKAGGIWVGTGGGGLNRCSPNRIKFEHYANDVNTPDYLRGGVVWGLLEDLQGHIWATVEGQGVHVINPQTGEYAVFQHDPSDMSSLSSNDALALAQDQTGNIWVGTRSGGLNKYSKETQRFSHYFAAENDGKSLSSSSINDILVDSEGYLWLAVNPGGGIIRFDPRTANYQQFLHDPDDSESLGSNAVICLYQDRRGTIWVGTRNAGLYELHERPNKFRRRLPGTTPLLSTGQSYVMSIAEDSSGIMWLGTYYGLIRFDPETDDFRTYTTHDGLANNVVYGVLTDASGRVWASSNRGLSRFEPGTGTFRNYSVDDGLQSSEFNAHAYFKSSDGGMFFGGINGFNAFHPDSVRDNPFVPPIVITGIRKFDQRVTPSQEGVSLRFSYKENFLAFEFAALDYTNAKNNQYAYKLDGLNEDWVYCGEQRSAAFTNLSPGDYVFRVKGSNNDGVWNDVGTSIAFVVTPPFWRTWWFRALLFLSGLGSVTFFIYRLREREKRKAELDRKFTELKLKALRSQMNPHFVFNTINSIQYFISSNEQKAAYNYLSKFSKLIRRILDNSDRATLTVREELEGLKLYLELEKLRFEGKFNYRIDVDPDLDVNNTEIPTLLIQPFVENAIQHGLRFKRTNGVINIKLDLAEAAIQCLIEDNGIGIEKGLKLRNKGNGRHKSAGMKVSQERLETINAMRRNGRGIEIIDLGKETGSASGTRVKIIIPLGAYES